MNACNALQSTHRITFLARLQGFEVLEWGITGSCSMIFILYPSHPKKGKSLSHNPVQLTHQITFLAAWLWSVRMQYIREVVAWSLSCICRIERRTHRYPIMLYLCNQHIRSRFLARLSWLWSVRMRYIYGKL